MDKPLSQFAHIVNNKEMMKSLEEMIFNEENGIETKRVENTETALLNDTQRQQRDNAVASLNSLVETETITKTKTATMSEASFYSIKSEIMLNNLLDDEPTNEMVTSYDMSNKTRKVKVNPSLEESKIMNTNLDKALYYKAMSIALTNDEDAKTIYSKLVSEVTWY